MNCSFYVIKLKSLIITLFIILLVFYVLYVCYSVFFSECYGTYILLTKSLYYSKIILINVLKGALWILIVKTAIIWT